MPLDPSVVRALAELGVPAPEPTADPVVQRERALAYEQAIYPHIGLPKPDVPTREHVVPVDGWPDVLVRLYYPSEPAADLPACLFFFGGAYCQGGIDYPSIDALCADRAARAGVVIAAVSYALAPEHTYPTQLNQAHAALEWLVKEGGAFGVDPTRIAVSGVSSGANLTAALTLLNRDGAQHPLLLQVLEVPVLDFTSGPVGQGPDGPTEEEKALMQAIYSQFAPRAEDRSSPLVSPLLAKDLSGLPPAYIFTAECDALSNDGEKYATALAGAGVPVSALSLLGMPHDGVMFTRVSLTARTAATTVVAALRTMHD